MRYGRDGRGTEGIFFDGCYLYLFKMKGTFSEVGTGGDGNAPLVFFVDGTVEMVYDAFVFYDEGFMGEYFVVGFGGFYEIGALPFGPMR